MEYILLVLGTLRITELLNYEKIFLPLREFFYIAHSPNTTAFMGGGSKIKNFIGEMLSCFSCTSVWSAIGMILLFYFLSDAVSSAFKTG